MDAAARIRVPEHVVHRDFGDETVVLNLESGKYHGLNRTAAVMLETLAESPNVAIAVDRLSREFDQPRERIERDVLDLCRVLAERELIEQHGGTRD